MDNVNDLKKRLEAMLKNKELYSESWSDPQWQAFWFNHDTLVEAIADAEAN